VWALNHSGAAPQCLRRTFPSPDGDVGAAARRHAGVQERHDGLAGGGSERSPETAAGDGPWIAHPARLTCSDTNISAKRLIAALRRDSPAALGYAAGARVWE